MSNHTTLPFRLTTAGQSIRILLQIFHALFITALWGAAAVGALVGYVLLVAQEPLALPLIPAASPFSHFGVVAFSIGAIAGLFITALFDGFFSKRVVISDRVALTARAGEHQGRS